MCGIAANDTGELSGIWQTGTGRQALARGVFTGALLLGALSARSHWHFVSDIAHPNRWRHDRFNRRLCLGHGRHLAFREKVARGNWRKIGQDFVWRPIGVMIGGFVLAFMYLVLSAISGPPH
jgi:hypothetical protein